MSPMIAGFMTGISPRNNKAHPRTGRAQHEHLRLPRLRLAYIMAAMVTMVTASCASPSPTTYDLEGTILLTDDGAWSSSSLNESCAGEGGYADIRGGADVVVRNEAGNIIATSGLRSGSLVGRGQCQFAFTVGAVPDAEFYAIEVAHRGELTYSAAEMEQMDWQVGLTLGD